jgi:hypothetical protein
MLNAAEHAEQIRDLWAAQIGNDRERVDVLAAHLANAAAGEAVDCITSGPLQIGSQSAAVRDTAIGPNASADLRSSTGSQSGAPPQEPPEFEIATNVPSVASSPPSAAPQRVPEKPPSAILASILKVLST